MSAVLAATLVSLRVAGAGSARRLLDSLETHALVRAHGAGPSTREDETEASRVIRRLVAKSETLVCSCRADGQDVLMRPHVLSDGRGTLRAVAHAHDPACPFRCTTAPLGHPIRSATARGPQTAPHHPQVRVATGFRVPLAPLIRTPFASELDAAN